MPGLRGYGGFNAPEESRGLEGTGVENITPDSGDVFGAQFREAAKFTVGRGLWDRAELEDSTRANPTAKKMRIEEANQKYGLELKPTRTSTITEALAEEYARRKRREQMDAYILQNGNPNFVGALGAGVAASLTDPIELGLGFLMPISETAEIAGSLARGAYVSNASRAARFLSRAPGAAALSNPFLAGAIEGGLSTAVLAPVISSDAEARGYQYTAQDALNDILGSSVAGGLIQGVPHTLGNMVKTASKTGQVPHKAFGNLLNKQVAETKAAVDFADGKSVDVTQAIDRPAALESLEAARQEMQQIFRDDELGPAPAAAPQYMAETQTFQPAPIQLPVSEPAFTRTVHGDPKPRFGKTELTFATDMDRALYIIGKGDTTSKSHQKFVDFVQQNIPGLTEAEIAKLGVDVRSKVIERAKAGEKDIPPTYRFLTPERKAPAPKLRPVELPENIDQFATDLERNALYSAVDPEGFRKVVTDHVSEIMSDTARLAEMGTAVEHADLRMDLQRKIDASIAELNAVLPVDVPRIPTTDTLPRTKGGLNKKSLAKMQREVEALNDVAVREMPEDAKTALLLDTHKSLQTELKNANKYLRQAEVKQGPNAVKNIAKWSSEVERLTAQLSHANDLVFAQTGERLPTPELSLQAYVDSLGGEVPGLKSLLENGPNVLNEPLYRVRNQIFDNLEGRRKAMQDFLETQDPLSPTTKFPENDQVLDEVSKYLERTDLPDDPEALTSFMVEQYNSQIAEAKKLGIWDEGTMARFDHIQEKFKESVERTNAVRDGSLQAQLCALSGVDED